MKSTANYTDLGDRGQPATSPGDARMLTAVMHKAANADDAARILDTLRLYASISGENTKFVPLKSAGEAEDGRTIYKIAKTWREMDAIGTEVPFFSKQAFKGAPVDVIRVLENGATRIAIW